MSLDCAYKMLGVCNTVKETMHDPSIVSVPLIERNQFYDENLMTFNKHLEKPIRAFIQEQNASVPLYYHLVISLVQFLHVSTLDIASLLRTQGFVVTKDEHVVMSDNAFTTYGKKTLSASRGEKVKMYFSMEVFITADDDVRRACSVIHDRVSTVTRFNVDDMIRMYNAKFPDSKPISKETVQQAFDLASTEEVRQYFEQLSIENPQRQATFEREFTMMLRTCNYCNVRTVKLPRCACKLVYYCDAECQKADWKTHKKNCIKNKKT